MRMVGWMALVGLTLASGANAACRRQSDHLPSRWAASIARHADVIMVAEVTQQEDEQSGKNATLRPIKVYKGARARSYTMALPPAGNDIVTESYAGFPYKSGQQQFVALYNGNHGYETSVCDQIVLADPAVEAAVIRKARAK